MSGVCPWDVHRCRIYGHPPIDRPPPQDVHRMSSIWTSYGHHQDINFADLELVVSEPFDGCPDVLDVLEKSRT